MKKYDFVKVVNVANDEYKHLIGEEGIIIGVDEKHEYPYEVVFFSKNAQTFSIGEGSLLWNDYELEGI